MLHNGPLRLTLTRRVVPVLSQNRELPWGGLAQVRGRKGSACSDNAIEEVAKHSGDRAAVPSAHRGRRRCTSSHRKTLSLWGRWRPRTSPLPHPLLYPAATLGVCTTVLKKVCRRHGIRRWPQRKLQSLNKLINNLHNAMKSTNGAARSPCCPSRTPGGRACGTRPWCGGGASTRAPTPRAPSRAVAEEHQRLACEIANLQTRKARPHRTAPLLPSPPYPCPFPHPYPYPPSPTPLLRPHRN